MKSEKVTIISLIILVICMILFFTFMTKRKNHYLDIRNYLIKTELHGEIINLEKQSKGAYSITIVNVIYRDTIEYIFGDFTFFQKNLIQRGDSVYKEPNNPELFFIKKGNLEKEQTVKYNLYYDL